MFFLIRYIFFVYLCTSGFSLLFAANVNILDAGQGNILGVEHDTEHGKKVFVLDSGSSGYKHTTFYQTHASSRRAREFTVFAQREEVAQRVSREGELEGRQEEAEAVDSTMSTVDSDMPAVSSSGENSPGDSGSSKPFIPIEASGQSGAGSSDEHFGKSSSPEAKHYKKLVFKSMINFVWGDEDRPISRIDFLGTHSDADHVNDKYLRAIFLNPLLERIGISEEQAIGLEGDALARAYGLNIIRSIILGGFKDEYSDNVHQILNILCRLGTRVIFTGSYDGSGDRPEAPSTPWGAGGYARAYSSFMPVNQRSPIEREIEDILTFGNGLMIQILAMNAGFAQAEIQGDMTWVANPDPNVNSIVLRFEMEGGSSFLAPADAEKPTWSFIDAMHRKYNSGRRLKTDYMLVSHHGSNTNEATSSYILRLFDPTVLLLSTGAHESYHHPSRGTVILLKDHLEGKRLTTQKHDITYFKQTSPRPPRYDYLRLSTHLPIFSTITGGTLSFSLDPSLRMESLPTLGMVTTSRHKARTFKDEGGQEFIAEDFMTFSSEQEMYGWLYQYMKDRQQKNIIVDVWKDENKSFSKGSTRSGKKTSSSPTKQVIKKLTEEERRKFLTVGDSAEKMEVDSNVGSSGSLPSQASAPVVAHDRPPSLENLVIRPKDYEGTTQWLIYYVRPFVDDVEVGGQRIEAEEEEDDSDDD